MGIIGFSGGSSKEGVSDGVAMEFGLDVTLEGEETFSMVEGCYLLSTFFVSLLAKYTQI